MQYIFANSIIEFYGIYFVTFFFDFSNIFICVILHTFYYFIIFMIILFLRFFFCFNFNFVTKIMSGDVVKNITPVKSFQRDFSSLAWCPVGNILLNDITNSSYLLATGIHIHISSFIIISTHHLK